MQISCWKLKLWKVQWVAGFVSGILGLEAILGLVSINYWKIIGVSLFLIHLLIFASFLLFALPFLLIGRWFGRGWFPSHRTGFQGGRGFVPRGHGRIGFHLQQTMNLKPHILNFVMVGDLLVLEMVKDALKEIFPSLWFGSLDVCWFSVSRR